MVGETVDAMVGVIFSVTTGVMVGLTVDLDSV